jgi:hypothetical protein
MASEADVLGKLNRIFETHAFSRDNPDYELEEILEDLDPLDQSPYFGRSMSPGRPTKKRYFGVDAGCPALSNRDVFASPIVEEIQ